MLDLDKVITRLVNEIKKQNAWKEGRHWGSGL